ncbi:MAG: exodeoxyribonuclease VII small subunit [Planctomycetota bacterium]
MKKKKDGFEAELKKLEEIREALETQELGLDEAIALYEQGMKKLAACRERLKEYETTLEKLMVEDAGEGDDEEA